MIDLLSIIDEWILFLEFFKTALALSFTLPLIEFVLDPFDHRGILTSS